MYILGRTYSLTSVTFHYLSPSIQDSMSVIHTWIHPHIIPSPCPEVLYIHQVRCKFPCHEAGRLARARPKLISPA